MYDHSNENVQNLIMQKIICDKVKNDHTLTFEEMYVKH
jgi:hypothetical protein